MTDTELLEAAMAKAGNWSALARVPTMANQVTLWRWHRDGKISTERQRAILRQYLDQPPEAA